MFIESCLEKEKSAVRSDMLFLFSMPLLMELHFEERFEGYRHAAPPALQVNQTGQLATQPVSLSSSSREYGRS
jgi:hypothetical protein